MGNMLLRGVVHRDGRRIKTTRADGTVIKLRSPVSVKEVLVDYPNHGIFEVAAGPRLGIGSLPRLLSEKTGLVAGHLYYVIARPISEDELSSASSRLQPESSAGIGSVRIVCSSSSTDGSTVRVKLRLRKEEVASFLSTNNVHVVMRNVLAPPLIRRTTRQSALPPWKPRLDTIAEPNNQLGDL